MCLQQLGVMFKDFPNSQDRQDQEGEVVEVSVNQHDQSPNWPPLCHGQQLGRHAVDVLEQWIKDYYASSAFNVCEHQK